MPVGSALTKRGMQFSSVGKGSFPAEGGERKSCPTLNWGGGGGGVGRGGGGGGGGGGRVWGLSFQRKTGLLLWRKGGKGATSESVADLGGTKVRVTTRQGRKGEGIGWRRRGGKSGQT